MMIQLLTSFTGSLGFCLVFHLRRRYLLGQRWEEIAVEMHYKYQHVCRCHRAAVAKLVIECDT